MNVTRTNRAYDMLADVYVPLTLTEQRVLTATIPRIDITLAADPFAVGEGRDGDLRVWAVPPLLVWYGVFAGEVVVTKITRSQPGRG